jgi:hypothetical protein
MDSEPAPEAEDGLHLGARTVPWHQVTPAMIREAAPVYARRTGVSRHRAWAALVSQWEAQEGRAL